MTCARAFGACVIGSSLISTAYDDYYVKALAEANSQVERLSKMNASEIEQYGATAKQKEIDEAKRWLEERTAENRRLEAMEMAVKEWTPPTHEHDGLKKFMLDQLSISKHELSYWEDTLKAAQNKSADSYYHADLKEARSTIIRCEHEIEKERKRAQERTDWVRQLRESLSLVASKG